MPPRAGRHVSRPTPATEGAEPVVELVGVTKNFGSTRAVDDLTLSVPAGRTVGLVGESGCGKSTVARLVLGLEQPTLGELRFRGRPYPKSSRGLRSVRRHVSMVFQDPYEALDPRCTLEQIVGEPLKAHGAWQQSGGPDRVRQLLAAAGLPGADLRSKPAAYSGGGRQRIGIARALALGPSLVVCDEPTSSLDVSIQAQIINLLLRLQEEEALSYLFISHDLDVVRRVSDDIAVLYAGALMERGPAREVTAAPRHPYTRALLSAVPGTDPGDRRLASRVRLPEERRIPKGACPFAGRCPEVHAACIKRPPLIPVGSSLVACHLARADDGTQVQGRGRHTSGFPA